MRIPISWLKEYVDIKISAEELSEKLTMSGTENEILKETGNFKGIVVGEILEIAKHPNADKLQVTKTSVGKEVLQIVCGGPNIEVGQKVPVAPVGTEIGEFTIGEAELRGVKSFGMLCSEAELGISDDHSGIMILDPRAGVGDSLSSALSIGDTVLEAEITPNRGDCLSIIGIAREVAVITGGKVKPSVYKIKESKENVSDIISVKLLENNLCSRYMARAIRNIKIGASPKWMQDRLSASGIRPINNVVDVTNYVMLEIGQPLHAFDAEKLSGSIEVRPARKGEKIETLDGNTRELGQEDLVIADSEKAVAIAGVMGGKNSEVTESTKMIVLESANFHPTTVRKTALKLALRSESSARFEKGLSLTQTEEALDRAASLLEQLARGEVLSGKLDEGEKKDKERKITLHHERIGSFLGENVSPSEASGILESLGFAIQKKSKDSTDFVVPSWRLDVTIEEDLLEEIARIYGYGKIPTTLPEGVLPVYEKNETIEISKKIRELLRAVGFFEVYTYSFTNKEGASLLDPSKAAVKIANPISQEQEYMRTDLLGSLIDVVSKNKSLGDLKIYEIASIYESDKEVPKLNILVANKDGKGAFHVARGAVDAVFSAFNIKGMEFGESGELFSGVNKVGRFTIRKGSEIKYTKVKSAVCFIEVDISEISRLRGRVKYQNIPKFPASYRDLTFTVDERVKVSELEQNIYSVKSDIRKKLEVVDIYRSKEMQGKKSVSLSFTYQSEKRTLKDNEVDQDQKEIINIIKKTLGGVIRGEEE